jgi:hypothetical protein
MKVKIIDYTQKHKVLGFSPIVKTFDLAWRYEQGTYQLAKYPTKTYLWNSEDEEKFMSGEEVWIHKDEVSIKIA